jgi:5-methylthioadenosine/S-adenosylhomocysteine deaminase
MIRAGVPVALGADGANCSNFFDMVRAMHLVATLYKDARRDVSHVPAETAVEMATINGAISLGAESELGSLDPGKLADMVLFDTSRIEWQPLTNVVYNLVYSATGASVDTVIVGGEVVVKKGRLTRIDEDRLIDEARRKDWRKWLAEKANLPYRQRWPES